MNRLHAARLLAMLLFIAMLTAFAACSGGDAAVDVPAESGGDVGETTDAETGTTALAPDVPDKTYDGAELVFLHYDGDDKIIRYYSELCSHEANAEVMNDAVYERTIRLEDKYDVVLTEELKPRNDIRGAIINAVNAGETRWDAIVPPFVDAANLTVSGAYLVDLNTVPYIDLSKPWWDSRVAGDMSFAGRTYSAIGALNTWTDSHTYAVVFNKELDKDYSVGTYDLVRDNKWTLDTFEEIITKVVSDIDGNGVMDENDRYGACSEYFNFLTHMTGCGVNLTAHNDEGIPEYRISQRFYDAAEKIYGVMRSGGCLFAEDYSSKYSDPWTDVLRKGFRANNALYYVGGIEQLIIFRDFETEIGLLPVPKLDEAQEDYSHTFSTWWATITVIPVTSSRLELTGAMLEAMNADSYYTDAVSYFDVLLQYKAMRDQDSYDMLQIIRKTRTMDLENAFGFLGARNIYTDALKKRDDSGIASSIASKLDAATAKLNQTMEIFK